MDPVQQILQLRQQGLTDELIEEELRKNGMNPKQINAAIENANTPAMPGGMPAMPQEPTMPGPMPGGPSMGAQPSGDEGNIYERIEAITESMIDEKWDALIGEVKKIVEWKEKVEEKQTKMLNDLEKLKGDFKILHQGVLGRLEDYDSRMSDVGTELKAVGKVFKDVIPEFVENVKELKSITQGVKKE
ncbi:hypothetical protein HOL59_00855 [Candidatus Woesearchaeota archaeon]|nr:hypothetical protein [Candidatus Woesearchaeota archaeon]